MKLLLADDKENQAPAGNGNGQGYGQGHGGGKGAGKGKKGGGKGSNKFVNKDGTEQGRCWEFDDTGYCSRLSGEQAWCPHAHVSARTGENENYVPAREWGQKGGGGKGTWNQGQGGGGGGKNQGGGAAAGGGGRKTLGQAAKEEATEDETEAQKIRSAVNGGLLDPRGLSDKKKGVETAMMLTLT